VETSHTTSDREWEKSAVDSAIDDQAQPASQHLKLIHLIFYCVSPRRFISSKAIARSLGARKFFHLSAAVRGER
jgi:hypothetical protein